MRKATALLLLAVIIASVALAGCSPKAAPSKDGKMLVLASIAPLGDFARQVGGDRVEVKVMVPPGASPHTYELKPSQLKDMSRARVLVLVGLGLEFWADKAISAANNPDLVVVKTSDGLEILQGENGKGNPHVWLDPINAIHMVELIRDAFVKADPAGKETYEANAKAYIERLKGLDDEIRNRVAGFSQKKFIAFHPAWVYFAKRYGLVQAAVVESIPGREPSPDDIARIVKVARETHARAIFAEPQFSPKAAKVIAEESGAQVVFLDPLGGVPGRETYIDLMKYNLAQMEKGLK
jgi:ABC-type Zn uptake system ZnuABC Zn-binding protein ZnuA